MSNVYEGEKDGPTAEEQERYQSTGAKPQQTNSRLGCLIIQNENFL